MATTNDLYYEVHAGTGPYLLMLHGMLSSRAQWRPNLEALTEVSTPVVVELWGHGRSPTPDDPAVYQPDAYVAAFERLRRTLGTDLWVVCGQSFGAALTLRYALDHPNRIMASIFTNSSSALADAQAMATMKARNDGWADAIEAGQPDVIDNLPFHPARATRLPEDIHGALLKDAALLDPLGVARNFRHTLPAISVRDRVAGNTVPTLLVNGGREKRFTRYRTFAADHMPHLEVIDTDAGHAVNIEAAAIFNQSVVSFLRRHGGG